MPNLGHYRPTLYWSTDPDAGIPRLGAGHCDFGARDKGGTDLGSHDPSIGGAQNQRKGPGRGARYEGRGTLMVELRIKVKLIYRRRAKHSDAGAQDSRFQESMIYKDSSIKDGHCDNGVQDRDELNTGIQNQRGSTLMEGSKTDGSLIRGSQHCNLRLIYT